MKLKKLFGGLFLSFALIAGVGAGLLVKENRENAPVEKVKADDDVYTVVGTMNSWNTSSNTYKLLDSDGDGIFTVNYTMPSSSDVEFVVVKNHSYDSGKWGYDNILIKPIGLSYFWNNNQNIGMKKDGSTFAITIAFKPSANCIMVFQQNHVPTSWDKKVYLISNWEWAYPRVHYWNSYYETVWDHAPSWSYLNRNYSGDNVSGMLYSCDLPNDVTYIKVRADGNHETVNNLDISGDTNNAVHYVYDSGDKLTAFKLYVVDNGPYLRGSWTDGWGAVGQKAMSGSSSGPFTLSSTVFTGNTECKALYINDGVETWANVKSVSSNDNTHFPCTKLSNGNAKISTAGNYTLTVTKSGDTWVYAFVCNDLSNAVTFASNFNTHISNKCNPQGATNVGQLKTQWGTETTTYSGLDTYVKGWLASNNPGGNATIASMFEKYDYVYGKYGSAIGNDFLGRNPTPRSVSLGFVPFESLISDAHGTPMLVIIIVSIVSVTAVGGYFFLRKRRNEK